MRRLLKSTLHEIVLITNRLSNIKQIMSYNAKIAENMDDEELSDSKQFDPTINLRLEATGNLLYHIHSTYLRGLLCRREETSLQFYEHVGE